MSKHTPGPWTTRSTGHAVVIEGPANDVSAALPQVAVVTCGNFTDSTGVARTLNEANAALIVAAPDMLAALQAARRDLETFEREMSGIAPEAKSPALPLIIAAIAKAEAAA